MKKSTRILIFPKEKEEQQKNKPVRKYQLIWQSDLEVYECPLWEGADNIKG